ncbi:MAG: glutathione S-transferase family protein [Alphaproteobacteria bacterium]|nr:glutathione S-transferase family protein [Alphaproteobacteria bacterium]
MIDVYTWPTPNGHKVHIMLEEVGLKYTIHPIAIGKGEQFQAFFLKLNPNHRIPAIVDQDGPEGKPMSLFESGAILLYLAEKTGSGLLPKTPELKYRTMQWLMFQMGGVGPMFGQANHFRGYAVDKHAYSVERYTKEAGRLMGVLDTRLGESEYLAGGVYTIADIATWPWLRNLHRQGQDLNDFPNVKRWFDAIAARPAVQRGIQVLADKARPANVGMTDEERKWMFGEEQYKAHKRA